MPLQIWPKKVFQYFDGSLSSQKVAKLHSVCIARCIRYIGNSVRMHNFKNICKCGKCQLIRLFLSTLRFRRHLEMKELVTSTLTKVSRQNYLKYMQSDVVRILDIPRSMSF